MLVSLTGHLGRLGHRGHVHLALVLSHQRVHLRPEETDDCHRGVEEEAAAQQHHLVGRVEGGEVGRQEDQPQEQGGGHRHKDVPRLVEVGRQFAGEEAVGDAHDLDEEVEAEPRE